MHSTNVYGALTGLKNFHKRLTEPAIPVIVAMDEKWKERRAHKDAVVSPSLIRPWPGEKFRYYPKFDLGIGAE